MDMGTVAGCWGAEVGIGGTATATSGVVLITDSCVDGGPLIGGSSKGDVSDDAGAVAVVERARANGGGTVGGSGCGALMWAGAGGVGRAESEGAAGRGTDVGRGVVPPPWSRDGNSVRDSRRELALGNTDEYWGVPAEATRGPLEVEAKLASETNAPEATTLAVEGSPPPPLPRRTCEVVGSL